MSRRAWIGSLAGLSAVAFALRFWGAHESPAGDELFFYYLVHDRSLGDSLNAVVNQEKTPPLGFALAWFTEQIGTPWEWMRAPSVVAGTALVPVTALLARRTFGQVAGVVAAAIVAVSPFFVFYGVEARAYSLAALFATAAALAMLRAADGPLDQEGEPAGGTQPWWVWGVFSLLILAAFLSHYTTVFAVATIAVWGLIARPAARLRIVAACGAAAVLFLPWLPSFITQFGHAGDEARRIADRAPLAVSTVLKMLGHAGIGHPFVDLEAIPGTVGIALILFGFVTGAVGLALTLRDRSGSGRPRLSAAQWLVVALAVTTLIGLIAASLQPHRSLLLTRNVISSVPAWAVLAAALLTARSGALRWVAAGAVCAGLAIGTVLELTDYQRPAMAKAADGIKARWQPGDLILESTYASGPPLDRDLAIHLNFAQRQSLRLTRTEGMRPFTDALKTGHSIFTVTPMAGYTTVALAPPPELRTRFTRTWWRSWHGFVTVDAVQWTPRR